MLQLTAHRLGFSDTFEVLVGHGGDQRRYILHTDLFTKRSGFFKAARSERWSKGTKPTELPDHEAETFEL